LSTTIRNPKPDRYPALTTNSEPNYSDNDYRYHIVAGDAAQQQLIFIFNKRSQYKYRSNMYKLQIPHISGKIGKSDRFTLGDRGPYCW
jgi:hypothetical protein